MAGDMLAPRAWKRTRSPACRQSRLKASNCCDSGRSWLRRSVPGRSLPGRSLPGRSLLRRSVLRRSVLRRSLLRRSALGRPLLRRSVLGRSVTEVEDPLHGAMVGLERVVIAGDGVGNSLQEAQCGVDILVTVKRDEGAGK